MEQVRIIELTPANVESIVAPLVAKRDELHERLERDMTQAQALQVRRWRVDNGDTWGWIGQLYSAAYPEYDGGQILGREACYRAALILGEDPHDAPWN